MSMIPDVINASLSKALTRVEQHSGSADELINVLLPLRDDLTLHEKALRQGVTYSSMARLLRTLALNDDVALQLLPNSGQMDGALERILRGEALNSASTLFTSWMSLVFMRTEAILSILRANRSGSDLLRAYLSLAGHDEVRRLRNALSHGTFNAEYQELEYRDGGRVERISFPNLNRLNSSMFALWTAVWAASMAPDATPLTSNETN